MYLSKNECESYGIWISMKLLQTNKEEECMWKLTSKNLAIITKGQVCGDS